MLQVVGKQNQVVKYFTNAVIVEDGGASTTDIKVKNVLAVIMAIYIVKEK